MAKRFNLYQTFTKFLTERNNVSNEIAVVNTFANNFPKGGLYCKGRLISKPQIPFAGVIEKIYQEVSVVTTTITNTNLYFLQNKNCFGIGDTTYATANTDTLSFKFHGQYLFNQGEVTNASNYGLSYIKDSKSNKFKLIPNEDFEYYVYNRPCLTYRIIGNPDEYFCKLHTDYKLKTGDYLLKDGTILPLEYYNTNFNNMILGIVLNTEYRSFLPFPIIGYNGIYINIDAFEQSLINDLAINSINEKNGYNILTSIIRYRSLDRIMPMARFRVIFPTVLAGYSQSLCKMYIPTAFECLEMFNSDEFVKSINNLDYSAIDSMLTERGVSTFANIPIATDTKDYTNIFKIGNIFSTIPINTTSDFFFLGNY
nr:MAG: hypothetical protein [Bacteriophage sp.]